MQFVVLILDNNSMATFNWKLKTICSTLRLIYFLISHWVGWNKNRNIQMPCSRTFSPFNQSFIRLKCFFFYFFLLSFISNKMYGQFSCTFSIFTCIQRNQIEMNIKSTEWMNEWMYYVCTELANWFDMKCILNSFSFSSNSCDSMLADLVLTAIKPSSYQIKF